jgi:hypothetical protein
MLHLDGSRHSWLSLLEDAKQTLITVVDDATSQLLYAQLWPGESVIAVLSALREVVGTYGIPASLYTDRAAWAFETPKAGMSVSKTHLTQVGEVLKRLGIEHIPSYSPQARGRSERMNGTLQGRLVNELRLVGARSMEAANTYIRESYLKTHNQAFSIEPREAVSAFVASEGADLDEIFSRQIVRQVGKDNAVVFGKIALQIPKQPGRRSCAGVSVVVKQRLDGSWSIHRGSQLWGRYDATGRPAEAAGPVENRKRPRFSTRTLDAGKQPPRPQLPQAPPAANL